MNLIVDGFGGYELILTHFCSSESIVIIHSQKQ